MTKTQELLLKLKEFETEERDERNPHLELTLEEVEILNRLLSYYV